MEQVIAILQARMHSDRLPGKILVDLSGKPMVSHVIERLQATRGVERVVVAVPETEAAYLAEVIEDSGADLVSGPVKDVLSRFYKAARLFPAPYYIRATADNPLIDTGMLARCITECKTGLWDMVGVRDMPLGTSAEVFPAGLLDYLNMFGRKPYHREHVTTLLYENEEDFRVKRLTPPRKLQAPGYRLTVDTAEDLSLMGVLYDNLYEPGRIIDLEDVVRFLKDYPDFAEINIHVRQKNWREESRRYSSAVA